jgi:hypothetical protein
LYWLSWFFQVTITHNPNPNDNPNLGCFNSLLVLSVCSFYWTPTKQEVPILQYFSINPYISDDAPLYGYPWDSLPSNVQRWIGVQNVNSASLLADVFMCFWGSLAIRSMSEGEITLQNSTSPLMTPKETFAKAHKSFQAIVGQDPKNWSAGTRIKYHFFRSFSDIVLVTTFAFGTVDQTVLSFFYLSCSLIFSYYSSKLMRKKNKMWVALRVVNYLIMWAKLLYQLPWLHGEGSLVTQVVGVQKISLGTVMTRDGIILDIVIFVVVSMQAWMYDQDYYHQVELRIRILRREQLKHAETQWEASQKEREAAFKRTNALLATATERLAQLRAITASHSYAPTKGVEHDVTTEEEMKKDAQLSAVLKQEFVYETTKTEPENKEQEQPPEVTEEEGLDSGLGTEVEELGEGDGRRLSDEVVARWGTSAASLLTPPPTTTATTNTNTTTTNNNTTTTTTTTTTSTHSDEEWDEKPLSDAVVASWGTSAASLLTQPPTTTTTTTTTNPPQQPPDDSQTTVLQDLWTLVRTEFELEPGTWEINAGITVS